MGESALQKEGNTVGGGDLPLRTFALDEIAVASGQKEWQGRLADLDPAAAFQFEPHFGWKGAVERTPDANKRAGQDRLSGLSSIG